MRYVEISEPKSRHSEPMKAQNAILRLSTPMLVRRVAAAWVSSALPGGGLKRPAVDAEQHDGGAHEDERQRARASREREDPQPQRRHGRPERPRPHRETG